MWLIELNYFKCTLVTLTRKKSPLWNQYTIKDPSYEYIGVHFARNLSWNLHIDTVAVQASRTLGYIKRNLKSAPPH